MSLLSRDQILTSDDLKSEDVPVPEWGGYVRVRSLTGTERDAFELSIAGEDNSKKKNLANLRARLVALCVIDEQGVRVFTDSDVHKLGLKSAGALSRVFDVASKLNGLSPKDVEDLAGNSDADQSGSSTSGSQPTSD